MIRTFSIAAVIVGVGLGTVTASADSANNPKFSVNTARIALFGARPGDLQCIGGQPIGQPFPPLCTPESKQIHTRGSVQVWMPLPGSISGPATDLLNGLLTATVNCNLNNQYQGRCWGTMEWDIPSVAGKWEGAWTGDFDLVTYVTSMSAVLEGSGGSLEGLHLKLDGASTGPEYVSVSLVLH